VEYPGLRWSHSGATVASLSTEVSQVRRGLAVQALVDKRCQNSCKRTNCWSVCHAARPEQDLDQNQTGNISPCLWFGSAVYAVCMRSWMYEMSVEMEREVGVVGAAVVRPMRRRVRQSAVWQPRRRVQRDRAEQLGRRQCQPAPRRRRLVQSDSQLQLRQESMSARQDLYRLHAGHTRTHARTHIADITKNIVTAITKYCDRILERTPA